VSDYTLIRSKALLHLGLLYSMTKKLDVMKNKILSLLALTAVLFSSCEMELSFEDDGLLVPLTVMEDPSIPAIDVDGVLLHSETFGNPSDPMLVVLHGGPGADYRSVLNFKDFANDSMFVVFYDQRGSGLSERLDKSAYQNVQVFIDELAGVIEHYQQNDSQKILLAGHSWGAMLATAYINQHSDEITGVILAEPGGFNWEQTESYIQRSRQLKLFDEFTNDFVYLDQFITGEDHNTLDYKFALSTAGNTGTGDVTSPPYWRYGAVCNTASIDLAINYPEQLDFTKNLNEFNSKALFVYSELNPAYGMEHANLLASFLPNVELKEILGCGHEMPHNGWDNLYPTIKNYLKEIL